MANRYGTKQSVVRNGGVVMGMELSRLLAGIQVLLWAN